MNDQPAACLFDLDGLLLDTEPLHGQAWSEAAAHFGGNLTLDQLLRLRGRRRQDCAHEVNQWLPQAVGCEALLAIQQPIARRLMAQAPAMPGAESLIEHCHQQGIPMALVTSSGTESAAHKSAPHPWLQRIEMRVLGDDPDLKAGKPDPAPFRMAAERLGVLPQQCWALEDSKAGTAAALAAGCLVWVLDPNLRINSTETNPYRINNLHYVLEHLINTND
ncbi:MAG: HAD family hydrolase [Cyanobium sp. NAT70]|nr:HAD family hydrolase [Cyanobium sp. NAT70]